MKRDTLAMLGSASPRNPSVRIAAEVEARTQLARRVAFERKQRVLASHARSVVHHPKQRHPPRSALISMLPAPASRLFSTSSLITLAGRSTTSPAATWLARTSGSTRIFPMAVKETPAPLGFDPRLWPHGAENFLHSFSFAKPKFTGDY